MKLFLRVFSSSTQLLDVCHHFRYKSSRTWVLWRRRMASVNSLVWGSFAWRANANPLVELKPGTNKQKPFVETNKQTKVIMKWLCSHGNLGCTWPRTCIFHIFYFVRVAFMTLYLLYASDPGKTANYFCTMCLFFIITNSIVTTKKRLYQTFFY